MKKLVVFDLDCTLAESKSALDSEMGDLLNKLLNVAGVAVMSGGRWEQFQKQLLSNLPASSGFTNLSLLPTCGTRFFKYEHEWKQMYSEDFSAEDKKQIFDAFHKALEAWGFNEPQIWGELIDDRDSQITFSALGQDAPLGPKQAWDPDAKKRLEIIELMKPIIPNFSIRIGGATSIDVTQPGIDKAYGIEKLRDILSLPVDDMLYVGDALFPGGNDYPVLATGIDAIAIRDPEETKSVIRAILACAK